MATGKSPRCAKHVGTNFYRTRSELLRLCPFMDIVVFRFINRWLLFVLWRTIFIHFEFESHSTAYIYGSRERTSDFRLQTSDFRLQTSDFRLQTSDFRLQTSDFRLQTSDFRLQTSDFKLRTSDFRLQTSNIGSELR